VDLVTAGILAIFASVLAGGIVGWIVGRFSAFELGLGVGSIVPGAVILSFAVNCLLLALNFSVWVVALWLLLPSDW